MKTPKITFNSILLILVLFVVIGLLLTTYRGQIDVRQEMSPTQESSTTIPVMPGQEAFGTIQEIIDNGAILTVTSDIEEEVDKIRALGFIGIMSFSSNHQPHHLMMANGMAHMLQ